MEQFQNMAGTLQEIESNLQACSREAACVKSKYEQDDRAGCRIWYLAYGSVGEVEGGQTRYCRNQI
jgi:hypothetical protein